MALVNSSLSFLKHFFLILVVEGWWTEHVGEDFCKYDYKSWSNTWSLVIYMIYLLNILQAAEYNTQQRLI